MEVGASGFYFILISQSNHFRKDMELYFKWKMKTLKANLRMLFNFQHGSTLKSFAKIERQLGDRQLFVSSEIVQAEKSENK